MGVFVYDRPGWPDFRWDAASVAEPLARLHFARGRLTAAADALGVVPFRATLSETFVRDALATSRIEGERPDEAAIRSSVAARLRLPRAGLPDASRDVDGLVDMLFDATDRPREPLTVERLHRWHEGLFPDGTSGGRRLVVGDWRDDREGRMQVVSGAINRPKVHFEAPEAARVPEEMAHFLAWIEATDGDPIVVAAIAHLRFLTIHPYEDGNGRIGRALADLLLARADGTPRLYSMSARILAERPAYYAALERAQRGDLDATAWVLWFLGCLEAAIGDAEGVFGTVRARARFRDEFGEAGLNERQLKVVHRLIEGLQGELGSALYAKLARCSRDTAVTDLNDLVTRGVLRRTGAARAVRYVLAF